MGELSGEMWRGGGSGHARKNADGGGTRNAARTLLQPTLLRRLRLHALRVAGFAAAESLEAHVEDLRERGSSAA